MTLALTCALCSGMQKAFKFTDLQLKLDFLHYVSLCHQYLKLKAIITEHPQLDVFVLMFRSHRLHLWVKRYHRNKIQVAKTCL